MLVSKDVLKEMHGDNRNLLNRFRQLIPDNNPISHQLGYAFGLFVLSDALKTKICIPSLLGDLIPSIRVFIIGDTHSFSKITELINACLLIMSMGNGGDEIGFLELNATTSYLKNNNGNSIIIRDFEKKCPKKTTGYIHYLTENFSNSICYVSPSGLSGMLKNNVPGIVSLYYNSLCVNVGDFNPTSMSHVEPCYFSPLKINFLSLINQLEKFSRIEFGFTQDGQDEIVRILDCTQKTFESDKYKYGLLDGISRLAYWIAILSYISSPEFSCMIKDVNPENGTLQLSVPDSYVDLALAEICTYYKKESQKYLKCVCEK